MHTDLRCWEILLGYDPIQDKKRKGENLSGSACEYFLHDLNDLGESNLNRQVNMPPATEH